MPRKSHGVYPERRFDHGAKTRRLAIILGLIKAIYAPGTVDAAFKRVIGLMTSASAGCQYCVAHTAHSAAKLGISEAKLNALWEYEQSPLYSEAERAALRVAQYAAQTPNCVTDDDYKNFAAHWSEEQQTEIISVISLFGFLNRWNATLATELEATPRKFMEGIGDLASSSKI